MILTIWDLELVPGALAFWQIRSVPPPPSWGSSSLGSMELPRGELKMTAQGWDPKGEPCASQARAWGSRAPSQASSSSKPNYGN